jgi:hypothetical protein
MWHGCWPQHLAQAKGVGCFFPTLGTVNFRIRTSRIKRYLRAALRGMERWLDEEDGRTREFVPFENEYGWINASFERLVQDELCARKEPYLWGVLQGAALAKVMGLKRISVIEFGVAGGYGLLALEHIAGRVEAATALGIDVYGFDTGTGLPQPQDYRDLPHMFGRGQFPMDTNQLETRLRRASLKLGLLETALPAFLRSDPAPVAFVSFDVDFYSSTREALKLFDATPECLLPRIVCYFDDVIGYTYCEFNGERLAISEFNTLHAERKVCPIYGARYFVPPRYRDEAWPEMLYLAHLFDHPLYNRPDQTLKPMRMEIDGAITGRWVARDIDPHPASDARVTSPQKVVPSASNPAVSVGDRELSTPDLEDSSRHRSHRSRLR